MVLARFESWVTDHAGNVVPGASVEIRRESDGGLASLYTDRAGTTPAGNPVLADGNGFVGVHLAGGAYRVITTLGANQTVRRYVQIGLLQEEDGAWIAYTPTVGPTSGAWTSHTVEGRYMRIGEMIVAHVRITVTNNGTGAGYVTASLPVARADQLGIVVGREVAVSGLGLFGSLVSATSIGFLTYANAYPLGASGVIDVMAVYKAAA